MFGETESIDTGEETAYGPFTVRGKDYRVLDNGSHLRVMNGEREVRDLELRDQVIGLMRFYRLTRIEPLFYTPLYDVPDFRKYEGYTRHMMLSDPLKDVPADKRLYVYRRRLNRSNLIAEDTIQGLDDVQEATDRFYKNTSYQNALQLLDRYRAQLNRRSGDITELIRLTASVQEAGVAESVVSRSGRSIKEDDFVENLRLINSNIHALGDEIDSREKLLQGGVEPRKPDISPVNYSKPVNRTQVVSLQEKRAWLKKWKTFGIETESFDSDAGGPYSVDVSCFGESRLVAGFEDPRAYPNLVIVDAYPRYGGTTTNTTEAFRQRISEEAGKWNGNKNVDRMLLPGVIYQELDSGKTLVLNQAANPFESMNCLYNENTVLNWQTVHLLKEQLSQERVYSEPGTRVPGLNDTLLTGHRLENSFLRQPSQLQAEKLGKNYRNLYLKTLEIRRNGTGLSVKAVERAQRARELYLLIQTRNAALEKTLEIQYHTADRFYWTFFDYRNRDFSRERRARQFKLEHVVNYSLFDVLLGSARPYSWRLNEKIVLYSGEGQDYSSVWQDNIYLYTPGSR